MVPTIVLVPGMGSVGTVLNTPLKDKLQALGYSDVVLVDLPSVDSVDRLQSLQPNPLQADIEHIRQIVKGLIESGKDVVIGAHSYGGTPSLHASEGLWKHARETQGQNGGVIKVALLSSSLSLPGESIAAVRAEWLSVHDPEMLKAQEAASVQMVDNTPFILPEGFEPIFFGDMSPDDQKEWASKGLRPSPLGIVLNEAPQSTISDWRISYLITAEQDPSMPAQFQQHLINHAKEAGVAIGGVKTLKSGHFVQITHAEEVAEWIKEISS